MPRPLLRRSGHGMARLTSRRFGVIGPRLRFATKPRPDQTQTACAAGPVPPLFHINWQNSIAIRQDLHAARKTSRDKGHTHGWRGKPTDTIEQAEGSPVKSVGLPRHPWVFAPLIPAEARAVFSVISLIWK